MIFIILYFILLKENCYSLVNNVWLLYILYLNKY